MFNYLIRYMFNYLIRQHSHLLSLLSIISLICILASLVSKALPTPKKGEQITATFVRKTLLNVHVRKASCRRRSLNRVTILLPTRIVTLSMSRNFLLDRRCLFWSKVKRGKRPKMKMGEKFGWCWSHKIHKAFTFTSFAVGIFAEAPSVHARGLRSLQHSADELLRRQLCLSRPRRHRQQRRQQDHLQHELRRRQRKLRQEVLLPWIHISERGQDTEVSEIWVSFEIFEEPFAFLSLMMSAKFLVFWTGPPPPCQHYMQP